MTSTLTRPSGHDRPPRRRRRLLVLAVVALLLLAVAATAVWWFLRDGAPAAVDLGTAAASVADDATATATSAVAGTWTVDTSVGEFSYADSTGTFVGFRVDEELAGLGSTTAVGRTPAVSGTVTIEGTTVTAATIEADLTATTTNDSRRDDRVQSALDTATYPAATFVLTEPVELGADAAGGTSVTVDATGDLTVHGITRQVTIPLQAQLVDGTIVIVGSTEITFGDYGVSVPEAPIVLSAEDTGTLELQLLLQSS